MNATLKTASLMQLFNGWMDRLVRPDAPPPRHLTQSIALEESPLPNLLKTGATLIGVLIGLFVLWAVFTRVDEVASATGQVIPSGYVQSVQHLEGGIVKDILVRDGDMVEAGQALIRLDDTSAGADLGQMQARKASLEAQATRLRRFTGSNSSGALDDEEKAILASMEDARERQRSVLNDQIAQKEKELKGLTASRMALEKNVALMQKENRIRQNLASKGYGSQLSALTSERELNQLQGQLGEATNQENAAKDAIQEAQNRLESLNADLKQEAMKNLGQVEAELAELEQTMEKYEHTANRTVITAPVRGVVKGLSVHTIGAVIEQGKVLMEIVPIEEELMVEALVQPSDIGHLKPGQKVSVKLSAYDYSRYGSVPGVLENVSATTFQNQEGQSFYKARIKLDRAYAGKEAGRNPILPGMTLQADIITGDKSVMQYLLKPIHTAVESAFHER